MWWDHGVRRAEIEHTPHMHCSYIPWPRILIKVPNEVAGSPATAAVMAAPMRKLPVIEVNLCQYSVVGDV